MPPANRFRDRATQPQWAELTRWAGDRASILFEDLRRRVGAINGLQEALYFAGPETGWVARYRVGDAVLFDVEFFPGQLESTLYVEAPLREKLVASQRVAAGLKGALRNAPAGQEITAHRFHLPNAPSVQSFAKLVRLKSQILARRA